MTRVLLADGAISLRLGDWRTALADVDACDAVICDPPYSERTHVGQRTGSSIRMPTIGYAGISEDDAIAFAEAWSPRARWWSVIFSDHTAFRWHERGWSRADWLTFAPLLVKQNPTPRFSGDGPAFALEFIMAARRRGKLGERGSSLPAYYECENGRDSGGQRRRTVAGAKSLDVMRAIVRDYTKPGDLVVDPFCGGGTTALACAMEGRRCITSELDPKTFELALSRLRTGHTPDMFSGAAE